MYRGHLMNCEDQGVRLGLLRIRGGTWQLYSSMSLAVSFHAFVSRDGCSTPTLSEKKHHAAIWEVFHLATRQHLLKQTIVERGQHECNVGGCHSDWSRWQGWEPNAHALTHVLGQLYIYIYIQYNVIYII